MDHCKISPMEGGCWYCGRKHGVDLAFSCEWDTMVHISCIEKQSKDDMEASFFAREFGITLK